MALMLTVISYKMRMELVGLWCRLVVCRHSEVP